jgi:tartrate dehydrogenase/decarboxylase / D-malate dehydrogenase
MEIGRATQRIAVIGGDGIGPEVIAAGRHVLDTALDLCGAPALQYSEFPWSCGYYAEHGRMMPADGLATLATFDAIYFGAVGWPSVPDHVSLWELLLPIRRGFDQSVNLRPVRLLEGVASPLAAPGEIDITVVRENTEGEYSDAGGRVYPGTPHELAI